MPEADLHVSISTTLFMAMLTDKAYKNMKLPYCVKPLIHLGRYCMFSGFLGYHVNLTIGFTCLLK